MVVVFVHFVRFMFCVWDKIAVLPCCVVLKNPVDDEETLLSSSCVLVFFMVSIAFVYCGQ